MFLKLKLKFVCTIMTYLDMNQFETLCSFIQLKCFIKHIKMFYFIKKKPYNLTI